MDGRRLKVFASLTHFLEELRLYRRDEKGQIVTENDSLLNATLCLVVSGIPRMRWVSRKKQSSEPCCTDYGEFGWMMV